MNEYDVIIIGAGPAGYAAGIYATRFGMNTLLIGKEPGGQVTESYEIENYPGFTKISGMDLAERFTEHAEALGVTTEALVEVTKIEKREDKFIVVTEDKGEYSAPAVILTTGAKKRKLDLPNEEKFTGRGISYCATCDGAFFREKTVGVIGGGDSAVTSALLLSAYADKVYLLYRREKERMRAMPTWVERAERNEKIEMRFNAMPKELKGENALESVIFDQNDNTVEIRMDGLFIEIGAEPESELAQALGVSVTEKGYIDVNNDMSTNVSGVFAAGDVTTGSNQLEQIVTACAEGAIAAESAHKFLEEVHR